MARIDRRAFLALLSTPAVMAVLQSCGNGEGADGSRTNGFRFLGSGRARASAPPGAASDAGRAINRLGADIYRRLDRSEANLVLSPASIMLALAITRAGAVGRTGTEMDRVLHTDETGTSQASLHSALNALSVALESRSGTFATGDQDQLVELAVANSLWGQEGVTWDEEFLDVLASEYGAGMRLVDFATRTEEARRVINGWVSGETNERIPELLGEGSLTPDIVLTLVNAIYMKAPWLAPFPETSTSDGPFRTIDGSVVTVPIMRLTREMSHAVGDRWQAVELPYVGGSLSMVLIVPDAGELGTVEAMLTEGLIDDVVTSLGVANVTLGLPRFDIETKVNLNQIMIALGMETAFVPGQADFGAMTSDEELFISFIIHQANITVDEKGTEAAAATAVGLGRTAAPAEPVALEIDRPFLCAVRDVPTGTVLFLGRVGDPR